MEENKKSKLGLGILIGVLISIIIGLTAFVVYDKVLSKDNTNTEQSGNKTDEEQQENNKTPEIESLSLTDSVIVNELVDTYWLEYYELGHYDRLYYHEKDSISASSLNNQLKIFLVAKNIQKSNSIIPYSIDGEAKSYYLSEFEKVYKKMFGKNTTFKYESTYMTNNGLECPGTKLNDTDSNLVTIYGGCGNSYGPTKMVIKTQLEKAEKNTKTDEIYIYELVAYPKYAENHEEYSNYTLYSDRDLTNYVSDKVSDLSKVKDKLDTYKYTFKSNGDGTYYFYSVERVK